MGKRSKRARRRLVSIAFVIVVAVLILVFRLVEQIGPEKGPEDRFVVVRVLDGDTMELQGGDRLRLLAIDTPEKSEPFHDQAAGLLSRLALRRTASVEYANQRRDKYGRLLGYMYIDTLFVNRTIIDSGYGYVYLFDDNELNSEYVRTLLAAQRSAIERRVGLWSLQHEPEPRYINTQGSFRLHRPGCRSLGELKPGRYQEFPTREEGLATGLSPCRNCKP
ncbi:MAG: thermonuclease family protein [Candidatus Zixiibacteriota bacterium]